MDFDMPGARTPTPDTVLPSPSPPPPPLSPHIQLIQAGHPQRNYILPQRFCDVPPEPPAPAPALLEFEMSFLPHVILIVCDRLATAMNAFGIWRDYPCRPSYDPDSILSANELANKLLLDQAALPVSSEPDTDHSPPWPFPDMSIYQLMQFFNSGSATKSMGEANCLVKDVLLALDFHVDDLASFDAQHENARFEKALDEAVDSSDSSFFADFHEASMDIDIPSGDKNEPSQKFNV